MAQLNDHYLKLKAGYLFPEIGRRVKAFCEANPEAAKRLIRCGIGDVTEPLPQGVITAMHKAVDEVAQRETFRGYGPEQGYDFLRKAIAQNDYRDRGLEIADDEIFVSDGSKCDCGSILDIFGHQNRIAEFGALLGGSLRSRIRATTVRRRSVSALPAAIRLGDASNRLRLRDLARSADRSFLRAAIAEAFSAQNASAP